MPVELKAAEVLREIQEEGVLNIAHLARRFGISPEAVRGLVGSLQDQGYLEAVEFEWTNSSRFCRLCPLRANCSRRRSISGIKIYHLTKRGRRIISGRDEGGREWEL